MLKKKKKKKIRNMTVYTCIQENIKLRKNSIDQCKIEPKVHIRCFLHCLHHSAAPVLNLSTVSVVAFAPSNNIICNIDVQETLDIKIIPCSNKTETTFLFLFFYKESIKHQ